MCRRCRRLLQAALGFRSREDGETCASRKGPVKSAQMSRFSETGGLRISLRSRTKTVGFTQGIGPARTRGLIDRQSVSPRPRQDSEKTWPAANSPVRLLPGFPNRVGDGRHSLVARMAADSWILEIVELLFAGSADSMDRCPTRRDRRMSHALRRKPAEESRQGLWLAKMELRVGARSGVKNSMKLGNTSYCLSENRPRRGGQAHFAPRAPQNEPVPAGSRIGSYSATIKSAAVSSSL